MIVSTNGSISKEIAFADDDRVEEILQTRLQEKSGELLAWVNEWHLIDLHALVFVLETALTMLRAQTDPTQKELLESLHAAFCGIGGATPILKRRADDEGA